MYQYHTLKNGIRLVFRNNGSAVTHSGVYINVGSRDEETTDEGIAHFIEHSIFKGTEHRRAYHILNRIDGVGGELNAFTTKEETCVYASSLSVHLERCIELFADILFHSVFPKHEIDKEKDVVLEEINSYKDSPAELIFDEFEEYAYSGHPLAHNILGNKKNVKSFTSEKLRTFMASHYTTDRMVVSIVGGVDFKRVVKLCERYFGEIETHTSANTKREKPTFRIFDTTLHRHTHQMHAMIGCEAYNLYDERKVAFTLLNNIVGGPAMNSRLNVAIREKYGFCYSVESQYTLFCDSGLFYIYAGIEPEAKERFVELARSELKRFCTTRLSTTQLHSAKHQYIGQMTINNEQALNEMQSIGKSCLNFDHVDSIDDMRRDIESITSDDILHIANELFTEDRMSHLFYQ